MEMTFTAAAFDNNGGSQSLGCKVVKPLRESGAITNRPDRLRSMPILALGHLVHQFLIKMTWSLESRTPRFVKGAFPTFRDWCPRPQPHLPRASGQHNGMTHHPSWTYCKAVARGDAVTGPGHLSPLFVHEGDAQTWHTGASIRRFSAIPIEPLLLDSLLFMCLIRR